MRREQSSPERHAPGRSRTAEHSCATERPCTGGKDAGVMRLALSGAVSLALLAAGCAAQAEQPYTPREASSPAKSVARAAPTTGPQTVAVGDGMRVRIEWPADPDPLLKVLTDYYVGSRRAVVTGADRYARNMEIDAEVQATEWVRAFTDTDQSLRGVARLYDLHVSAARSKGAQIDMCVDESRLRLISTRTGKAVTSQPEWTRKPYHQAALAHRGDDGVWRIRALVSDDERCER
ncbi:hypothetical protein [Nonomuraea sp. NPDC048916]|uniref:hypothetical protein n=1 Tax=Nonomuraea sp. NPDC048916 TaxID=3154232 RepID=UPI0033F86F7C